MVSHTVYHVCPKDQLLSDSRSSQLVVQISLVHGHLGVCSHLLLQLPRGRPNRSHNPSDGRLLWAPTRKCELRRGHFKDGLLLHYNGIDAGHRSIPVDATDQQIRSPSSVRFFVCAVHGLRYMGRRIEELWQRAGVANRHGCCGWCC